MNQNYAKFYLNMLVGLTFIIGINSIIEFGLWSFIFFQRAVIWVLGIGLAMLYMREKQK